MTRVLQADMEAVALSVAGALVGLGIVLGIWGRVQLLRGRVVDSDERALTDELSRSGAS